MTRGDLAYQPLIGWQKRVGADLGRGNPATGFTPEGAGFAGNNGASVETESDMAPSITVLGRSNPFVNGDREPELFHDLSGEARLEALGGLPLAAGKLPQSTQSVA